MAIRPLEKDHAPDVVQKIYDALEKNIGRVPNFFKMLGHKPDILRTFNQFYSAVWADGPLSPKLKELAYLRASILNGCEY